MSTVAPGIYIDSEAGNTLGSDRSAIGGGHSEPIIDGDCVTSSPGNLAVNPNPDPVVVTLTANSYVETTLVKYTQRGVTSSLEQDTSYTILSRNNGDDYILMDDLGIYMAMGGVTGVSMLADGSVHLSGNLSCSGTINGIVGLGTVASPAATAADIITALQSIGIFV